MTIAKILTRKTHKREPTFVRNGEQVGSLALDRNGVFMVVLVDQQLNLVIENWDANDCQIVPKWEKLHVRHR